MALQINRTLTTKSGFNVDTGSYVWMKEDRGGDKKYSVEVRLIFFKNKAAFDAGNERFLPQEVPDDKMIFRQEFTANDYANLTSMTIHTYVKQQLELALGNNTVQIVA